MAQTFNRRSLLAASAALLAAPALIGRAAAQSAAQSAVSSYVGEIEEESAEAQVRRNTMSFRSQDWQDHFTSLDRGGILCDLDSRALHYWGADGTHLLYPTSVPMSDDFARRGRTEIILKRRDPVWIPTPNMRARDPSLPARVEAGPMNPMGTRAMNLTWQYYRIHGIDNEAKIGRRASNGCIGLYNHHVETLFELVEVGTPVVVI